jgi:hypothetical protein
MSNYLNIETSKELKSDNESKELLKNTNDTNKV